MMVTRVPTCRAGGGGIGSRGVGGWAIRCWRVGIRDEPTGPEKPLAMASAFGRGRWMNFAAMASDRSSASCARRRYLLPAWWGKARMSWYEVRFMEGAKGRWQATHGSKSTKRARSPTSNVWPGRTKAGISVYCSPGGQSVRWLKLALRSTANASGASGVSGGASNAFRRCSTTISGERGSDIHLWCVTRHSGR